MIAMTTWVLAAALFGSVADAPVAMPEPSKQETPKQQVPRKELERPTDWVVRHFTGGMTGKELYFVKMPPGWHITTGPGTLLFRPETKGTGRFRVEAEIFLFPGTSEGGHGIFYGGQQLDGDTGATYWAWTLQRDGTLTHGHYQKGAYSGGSKGAKHPAVAASSQDKPVKNVLAVEIDGTTNRLFVNGQQVAVTSGDSAPAGSTWDGIVGLRVDPDVNLHVTRLDVTPLPDK